MEYIIQFMTDPAVRTVIGALMVGLVVAFVNHRLELSEQKQRPHGNSSAITPRLNVEKPVPLVVTRSAHFNLSLVGFEVGASLSSVTVTGTHTDVKRPRRGTRRKQMKETTQLSAQ